MNRCTISLGCRAEIQATLERSQGIERIIQGLVFFDRVGAGGKKFAGPASAIRAGTLLLSVSNRAALFVGIVFPHGFGPLFD